jgi:Dihydrodipicolinate synthase/N-acetylneuraminate lyase
MQPFQAKHIKGNWGTLLLPVGKNDVIDWKLLEEEIDLLIQMGVSGIYSNGTAGEFYNQTEEEFDTISQLLAQKCHAAGMPFQIGACHVNPVMAKSRVARATALQPGAIQVILPDWSAPSMSEIIHYLQVLAQTAAPVPLVLYNPPHAKRKLLPEEYGQLKDAGIQLAGCKTAGGDEAWYTAMKQYAGDISLFVPGHQLATGIQLGAHGAYSNVACLHPRAAQRWYELMLTDMPRALQIQDAIQAFIKTHILPYLFDGEYTNQAVDKLLAAIGNWVPIGTGLRWPYRGIDEKDVAPLRAIALTMMPEFFALA